MREIRSRPGLVLFALAIALGSIAALRGDVDASAVTPFTAVAVIAIIIGEQMPTHLAQRVMAPLTTAPALGLILAPLDFGGQAPSAATVLGIVWLSILVGGLLRRAQGRSVVEGSLGARFLGMALTAVLAREVVVDGSTLVEWAFSEGTSPVGAALSLLAVAAVGGFLERLLENVVLWLGEGATLAGLVADEVRPLAGVAVATASAGPLIAVAKPVLDWVAIPLLVLPVLVTYLAVQWVLASRRDLEESMAAMSRLPEVVGCSPAGHGRRVADLSVRIAEGMGMDPEMCRRVEKTAMLHDLGQLGLREPLPGGATIHASSQTQDRIAATSVRIVGSSPMFEELLPLLDQVRTPFRRSREFGERIPLEARIVRVANAWDDITEGARSRRARQVALERLHLGLGYDYDPEVVAALERTLVR